MGKGTQYQKDGSVFIGTWVNDVVEGQGRLILADGSYLQGDWEND
jgi:hypothetical protein